MKRRLGIVLAAVSLCLLAGGVAAHRWATAVPVVRELPLPAVTDWRPQGPRNASRATHPAIPDPDTFHTMHVGVNNTDEIWSVTAPLVEYDWTAEPGMFVPEGPTFDNEGNLYFSPYNPKEDVSLVVLDWRTGERRWSVPGRGAGSGAILVLDDPDRPGRQLVYHATYTTAMALRPDGSVVWEAPTGLEPPPRRPGELDATHVWGMNYHPQADAVLGVTMDGHVFAHDRRSGRALLAPIRLPGAPAASERSLPGWIKRAADDATDAVFGRTIDGRGLFSALSDVIFGRGVQVANFYGVDPETGRIYVAATAPDESDGSADGVSRSGALHLLELTGADGRCRLEVVRSYSFDGGTGSTPTISPNSDRVVVSDDNGNVIALDRDLDELWRVNVGAQVAASIAVASDNAEMYAVTQYDVVKLIDRGDAAEIAWRATLDAYPGFANFNALTPTITANGVAVSIGAGRQIGERQLMHKVGVGLLDRETGRLRSFAEGREESIAVTVVGPDGGFYLANSPTRRAVLRGLLGERVAPLLGGIQRFRPVRSDLVVRDAACAGAARARNAQGFVATHPKSVRDDLAQIGVLTRQAERALATALERGDVTPARNAELAALLATAGEHLAAEDLALLDRALTSLCGAAGT